MTDLAEFVGESSALISECGRYRYSLTRRFGAGSKLLFVGLNPSTADEYTDDPTIRRLLANTADDVLVGWGTRVSSERSEHVAAMLTLAHGSEVYCLGTNADGTPKHPLYVPYSAKWQVYR